MDQWFLKNMEFECKRCTRKVTDEEAYLIFDDLYCRACEIAMSNDPDYVFIMKKNSKWMTILEN